MKAELKNLYTTEITRLVYTSVQDMQSSIHSYGVKDLDVLRKAHKLADHCGHKTRCKLLAAKIRKLEKETAA